MSKLNPKLQQLQQLIQAQVLENGIYQSPLEHLLLFRESQSQGRVPLVYEPALFIAAQGRKQIYLQGKHFEYNAGHFLALFTPMAIECELIDISESKPMLAVCIRLDRLRLTKLLIKMDNLEQMPRKLKVTDSSGIFTAAISDKLLDAVIRLLKTLDNATEANIIGESIIDEIYFRILNDEQGGALRLLLRQQGQIQQISKAVEYLNQNLDQNVSVDLLAQLAGMSTSGFHKKFKQVMHLSPLQYIKLIRLNKAKNFIIEGKNVSEAGYLVGYNSPAQFSREYKRQFGISPAATQTV